MLGKQPNNKYDKKEISAKVKGLGEQEEQLTEVGHLPRDLTRALQFLTNEELRECEFTVVDEKARVAPGLKGLQIKVAMNFHIDPKRAKVLKRRIKNIEGVKLF